MLFFLTSRHILAAVHFNFNLHREDKCKESNGEERVRVSYPKFKNGEATVRSVKINPNFEYVEEIFQEYLSSSKDELEEAARKLKNMNPAPMNTMLQKQPREEAIEKRIKRSKMVVEDVPPTTPLASDQPVEPTTSNKRKGKKRKQKTSSEGPDQPVPATTGRRKKRKQETSCVGPKKPRHCSL
ncbi:PREDICTED: uncharacterized protein LOC107344299 [Acropora digitifera]|uniref:uncharacterized protein LOC107344299 n=1 Tax=Acropora digitifera TaxID=70779 RepID=UPI00077A23A7|nr:PREDICTED: uncharacterized protein LOC107344299 [Acropora digitifera]